MSAAPVGGSGTPPEQVIGPAIQDLVAKRLGRGFVPLAVLLASGVVGIALRSPGSGALAFGALAAGATMLAYGLRISQRAFGRRSLWMAAATVGSIFPPAFGLYVFAWRGLRAFAGGGGLIPMAGALFFTLTGIWSMRVWLKLVEVERLSKTMLTDPLGGDVRR